MARLLRDDHPDALFHVTIRGIARRPMFEDETDVRYYKACLARASRRREISVLSYCILHTHAHVFAQSHGRLSRAFQVINSAYTRRFNRRRGRDGAVQRGRFHASPVEGELYAANVRAYIDENPVVAELAERPEDYAWGSRYARARGLHRQWLGGEQVALANSLEEMQERAEFVELRRKSRLALDPGEGHLMARGCSLPEFLLRRIELSDGSARFAPVVGPMQLTRAVRAAAKSRPRPASSLPVTWDDMLAGMLWDLGSATYSAINLATSVGSTASARRQVLRHQRALRGTPSYREAAASVLRAALGGV